MLKILYFFENTSLNYDFFLTIKIFGLKILNIFH